MEYRLNKIDPELRTKINETTKGGKIHRQDNHLNVNKDGTNKEKDQKSFLPNKQKSIKPLLVDAIKVDNINIEVFVDKDNENKILKGRFLDIRK